MDVFSHQLCANFIVLRSLLIVFRGVQVQRAYCGTFMTSLEMSGVSLTVLHLDKARMKYLGKDIEACCWHGSHVIPLQ